MTEYEFMQEITDLTGEEGYYTFNRTFINCVAFGELMLRENADLVSVGCQNFLIEYCSRFKR